MPIIKFVHEKKEIEVPEGANLRAEAMKAGVTVYQGFLNGFGKTINRTPLGHCPGIGMCGTCKVRVVKGNENCSSMGMLEKAKFKVPFPDPIPALTYIGNEETLRLSCQTQVYGDIEVETGPPLDLFGENFFS